MQDDLGCPGRRLRHWHHIWEDELLLIFVVVGRWQIEALLLPRALWGRVQGGRRRGAGREGRCWRGGRGGRRGRGIAAGVWLVRDRDVVLVDFVGFGERLTDVQVRIPGWLSQRVVDVTWDRLCPD